MYLCFIDMVRVLFLTVCLKEGRMVDKNASFPPGLLHSRSQFVAPQLHEVLR